MEIAAATCGRLTMTKYDVVINKLRRLRSRIEGWSGNEVLSAEEGWGKRWDTLRTYT